MRPPSQRLDEKRLFGAELEWRVDPEDFMWLRATFEGDDVFLRINASFPDEPLYSLLVEEDETVEFDDLPAGWVRVGTLAWPEGARRRPIRP